MDTLCHPIYRYVIFFAVVCGSLKYSFTEMSQREICKIALMGTAVVYVIDYARKNNLLSKLEKMESVQKVEPVSSVQAADFSSSVGAPIETVASPVAAAEPSSIPLMPASVSHDVSGASPDEAGSPLETAFSEPSLTGLPAVAEVTPMVDVDAPSVPVSQTSGSEVEAASSGSGFLPGLGGDLFYDLNTDDGLVQIPFHESTCGAKAE